MQDDAQSTTDRLNMEVGVGTFASPACSTVREMYSKNPRSRRPIPAFLSSIWFLGRGSHV